MEQKILAYLKEHETEIFEDLKSLVLTEASTSDIEALAKVREKLVMLIKERTGEDCFVYEAENGHCPVRFQYGKGTEKILFIGHYDTVHLIGALKYYTEGNGLHGPGVYDMKGGLISAIWTVKAYKDLGIDPGKRLEFIFNGDEETGSAESTDIICELAKDAKAALVCEPCTANGDLKTGRKGLVRFTVRIHGKASHAGNAHKEGINAIEELAHEILAIQKLTDYEAGTTVNVGVCSGGTKPNVVPAEAEIEIDCRVKTAAEGDRIRNYVLMDLPEAEQEECYTKYWNPIEANCGYDVSGFVRDWLTCATGRTPAIARVYPEFRGHAANRVAGDLLAELLRYSELYR